MRALCITSGFLLLLTTACSNRKALEKADQFVQTACKCATQECAEKAMKDFVSYFENNTPRGSKKDAEGLSAAHGKITECSEKLRTK